MPSPPDLAIDLKNVTKVYKGKILALQGVDMQVRRGEIFGLLGPNGAGKSTLVKIMMTVVRPTTAEGTLLGDRIGHKATLAKVGYLPENHRFPRYLTGRQCVEFFGALAKVDRPARKRRAAELIETVGMTDAADRKIATYSKGMAQRIGLAQALVNDPDLVLLDEPTDGVDPGGRRDIREVMARMKAQGKTVFVNSHLLSELEVISDRVAILVGGKVARQGTIDELTVAKQRYEIEVVSDGQPTSPDAIVAALGDLLVAPSQSAGPPPVLRGKLPAGDWVELRGPVVSVGVTDPLLIQPVLDRLRQAGLAVRRVQPVRPSLEDLFMEAVDAGPFGEEGGRVIGQTLAMFLDAYRELNAKRMFWIVLGLSGLVVLVFAAVGVKDEKLTLLWFDTPIPIIFPRAELYKMMFSAFGISIWLAFAATILALISTASIFPDFISGGSIDLYLSKPISRLRLFVTKYLTGLLFVALQVGIFATASYFVIGIRGGVWENGIFLAVPLVVCFFSYLFSLCVLFGVITRSTLAAVLLTILCWFFLFCLDRGEVSLLLFKTGAEREAVSREKRITYLDGRLDYMMRQTPEQQERSQNVIDSWREERDRLVSERESKAQRNLTIAHQIAYGLKTILPKTRETTELLNRKLLRPAEGEFREPDEESDERRRRNGPINPADIQKLDQAMRSRSLTWVIGTSLGFEAVVLGLAAWIFCRRDF